jgi:hypothetical protein
MDEESKLILKELSFEFDKLCELDGIIIERDKFLSDSNYDNIKKLIPTLKRNFSSSFMTSLQKNAEQSQKWPLLNLVRQILSVYNYKMVPIRKSDGYTNEGIKKYKRYFRITKN